MKGPLLRLGLLLVGICGGAFLGSAGVAADPSIVRLAVVYTPEDSGLLGALLPDFERQSGYQVQVYSGEDVYDVAREGRADLVISHYGHPGTEPFVMEGLGLWPRPVFANQAALLGPSADPAGVRGLDDATEAFRRIAQSRSPFVANNSASTAYLEGLLWEAAGQPSKGEWYVELGLAEQRAVEAAAQQGAYTLWGVVPFLGFRQATGADLDAMVLGDPLLQRMMVSVVVDAEKVPGVNAVGAMALQQFLLTPATQARIREFRMPGLEHQVWWPEGRHNSAAALGVRRTPQDRPSSSNEATD